MSETETANYYTPRPRALTDIQDFAEWARKMGAVKVAVGDVLLEFPEMSGNEATERALFEHESRQDPEIENDEDAKKLERARQKAMFYASS